MASASAPWSARGFVSTLFLDKSQIRLRYREDIYPSVHLGIVVYARGNSAGCPVFLGTRSGSRTGALTGVRRVGRVGTGTGSLKAHLEALRAGGASFYVSGMSAKSRGFDAAELGDLKAEFAMPAVLVRLAAEVDRVLCY